MSADRIARLRAVGPAEDEPGLADIPVDVLRFAVLPEERRTLLLQVNDLVDEIDYGTVVIVMHEGKVTQIEMSEKIRLSREPSERDDRPRG
jgi:hypothetical protein